MDEHLLRYDKTKTLLFIDVETENLCLHSEFNLPWQVAMIKVVGDKIEERFEWLVKWHRNLNISEQARIITRFDDFKYKEFGVSYKEVLPTVIREIKKADYVLGHNFLGFDIYHMLYFAQLMSEDLSDLAEKVIDTNAIAKGIKIPVPYNPKTTTLLEYQYRLIHLRAKGIKTNTKSLGEELKIPHDYEHLHDALNDLELNVKIWNKLKWQIEI